MRDVLLDTHAFLWFVAGDTRLGGRADALIADPGVTKHFSVVSLWEIAIKSQLGKLRLGTDYDTFVREHITRREIELVPLELRHLSIYASLPLHHRDPFDRLIIAQAKSHAFTVLTGDAAYVDYGIDIVW